MLATGGAKRQTGNLGVGKTHLTVALGREVIERGYSVLFISAMNLVAELSQAHRTGRLEEKQARFVKPKLLINYRRTQPAVCPFEEPMLREGSRVQRI